MPFLDSLRSKDTYIDRIPKSSPGTIVCEKAALRNFEDFTEYKFHVSSDNVLIELRKLDGNRLESTVFDILQNFSNFMIEEQRISIGTSKNYVKRIKNYLNYLLDTKIHNEDLKQNMRYPREEERDNYPLSADEARKIMEEARKKKTLYLFQLGTGIAIGEAMKLRKRDFSCEMERIKVVVPAKYRKVRATKRTFVPKWIEPEITALLAKKKDDDTIFTKSQKPLFAVINETNNFDRVRDRAGLGDLIYDSGTHKITIHSFRSWFITKANKVDFGLGNALAGQGYYMKRYSRYTEKEMMKFFLKAEPFLNPYQNNEDAEKQSELMNVMRSDLDKAMAEIERLKFTNQNNDKS